MERLTKRYQNGKAYVSADHCFDTWGVPKTFEGDAIDRLAHYEDLEERRNATPLTNADRIRAMTDEDLAQVIADNASSGVCNDFGIPHERCGGNCYECALDWLKAEAALAASGKEG